MPVLTVRDLLLALAEIDPNTPVAQFADRAHNDGDQSLEVALRPAADGRPSYVEVFLSGSLHPALDLPFVEEEEDEQE